MPGKVGRAFNERLQLSGGHGLAVSFFCGGASRSSSPTNHRDDVTGQLRLSFAEIEKGEVYEYAALVTSLDAEILTLGQLYRDRADCENVFEELKNQWGWGEFTTHDLARCRLAARLVALVYNWWNLFVRLAEPTQHLEAISSRPLLLTSIASAFVTRARRACALPAPTQKRTGWLMFWRASRAFCVG